MREQLSQATWCRGLFLYDMPVCYNTRVVWDAVVRCMACFVFTSHLILPLYFHHICAMNIHPYPLESLLSICAMFVEMNIPLCGWNMFLSMSIFLPISWRDMHMYNPFWPWPPSRYIIRKNKPRKCTRSNLIKWIQIPFTYILT